MATFNGLFEAKQFIEKITGLSAEYSNDCFIVRGTPSCDMGIFRKTKKIKTGYKIYKIVECYEGSVYVKSVTV